eukprot:9143270-Pyramimonas_sp.AAC.1
MLSTATLEGAQASTFWPRATDCRMNSTTVVVFPVPGGPWMSARSDAERAKSMASSCELFSPVLNGAKL